MSARPDLTTEALSHLERLEYAASRTLGAEDSVAHANAVRAVIERLRSERPAGTPEIRAAFIEGALWRGSQKAISGDSLMKEATRRYGAALLSVSSMEGKP